MILDITGAVNQLNERSFAQQGIDEVIYVYPSPVERIVKEEKKMNILQILSAFIFSLCCFLIPLMYFRSLTKHTVVDEVYLWAVICSFIGIVIGSIFNV